MKAPCSTIDSDAGIWERAVEFERELSPTAARVLLGVRISACEHASMSALLAKARAGTLTTAEEQRLDTYEKLGCLLGILHSKVRQVLKQQVPRA